MFVGIIVAAGGRCRAPSCKIGRELRRGRSGAPAPEFRVIDLATGDSVSLRKRYKGKVTLVNIWATWCVPCRQEMPAMEQLYKELAPRGFAIAAVSIDADGPEDGARRSPPSSGSASTCCRTRATCIQQRYQTTGVPESFLLDRDGGSSSG